MTASGSKGRQLSLPEKLDPRATALVVIDVQNHFCHAEGDHGCAGADLAMVPEMTARLRELVAAARQARAFIVWVRATYDEIVLGAPLAEVLARGGKSPVRCEEGSWGADWFGDLRPDPDAPNEVVVTKHRFSAFWDSDIDLYLRSNGIATLVLGGIVTSGCVESTARDAYFRNYYVVLPRDASASYSRQRHENALDKLALTFGVTPMTADILPVWRQAAAGPRNWELAVKEGKALAGVEQLVDPAHAALVIVDMQNDFCHPAGLMGSLGEDLSHNRAIIPTIRALLDAARDAGTMVIFIQAQYGPSSGSPTSLYRNGKPGYAMRICLPGSWGAAIVDELAPRPGESIVVKHRYSAFRDTALESLLRSNAIRSLVVVGTATQACVESTVRDARMNDYAVVVPNDGVGARARMRDMHDASLKVMGEFFATVVPASEILASWSRRRLDVAAQ
jgi:nicotinamidase-related amidase